MPSFRLSVEKVAFARVRLNESSIGVGGSSKTFDRLSEWLKRLFLVVFLIEFVECLIVDEDCSMIDGREGLRFLNLSELIILSSNTSTLSSADCDDFIV